MNLVIADRQRSSGMLFFWSKEKNGWVQDFTQATVFEEKEQSTLQLPSGNKPCWMSMNEADVIIKGEIFGAQVIELTCMSSRYDDGRLIWVRTADGVRFKLDVNELMPLLKMVRFTVERKVKHSHLKLKIVEYPKVETKLVASVDQLPPTKESVKQIIANGNVIEAIKFVRTNWVVLGLKEGSLIESKNYCDEIRYGKEG